ncbi:MAG: 3-deoxy-8-phosphooctulonate synthase [Cytophagales bacterium]|nr:3-deoxy-8-phosphooctulonate synthase [Cytophagales bacterium]
MQKFLAPIHLTEDLVLGGNNLVLLAGPCAVENQEICLEIATKVKQVTDELGISYIFKASFDKANRTSSGSFRGLGFDEAMSILQAVKEQVGVPLVTDIHESHQVSAVAEVVDVLQIPAFLCRQTDLLVAAGKSGKAINIKRGQFMAPEDMQYALEKIRYTGNQNACLTERGVTFGYHNLVVDMRSLPVMRQFSPVIFDVTHSVQQPGGAGGASGGQRAFAPYLARAAAAAGVDGFFIETHPEPSKALSDGPNMVPLKDMPDFLKMIREVWEIGKSYS